MVRIIGRVGGACGALMAASLFAGAAGAQVQTVFGGGGTAFEPEIGVVYSGAVTDVQATVSHDLKYVTLNMRAQNAQLLNLFTFNFQQAGGQQQFVQLPGGFAGGVNPVVGAGNGAIPALPNAPMRVGGGNGGKILLTRGITPLVGAGR